MAKKKLNRKVALIGSFVFLLLAVLVIVLFLYLGRDPHKFLQYGDNAMKAAQQATDPQQREDLYKEAERNYKKAFSQAKTDELKIVALYRLADNLIANEKWRDALGCWTQIVRLDAKDVKARYGRLKYFYVIAQTSAGSIWQEVVSQASEFIDMVEKPGGQTELAQADTEKWEVDALLQRDETSHRLLPYLHLIRGRANLTAAELGLVPNKQQALAAAVEDLEKVRQLEKENVEVYFYLARAEALKGTFDAATGSMEAKMNGYNKGVEILKEGIEASNHNQGAYINLMTMKHAIARVNMDVNQKNHILELEPEYIAIGEKFSSSPEIFAAISDFYSDYYLGAIYLDKAIEASEKTLALDANNAEYSIKAANLYYRRYSIRKQKQDMEKAIEIAKKAIMLPDVQNLTGPRSSAARVYQVQLNGFLANIYMDQIFALPESQRQSEGQQMLSEAQQAVRQIEQIYGSGDDPQVIKWQGTVELAAATLSKGDAGAAVRKLYKTYTQMKASSASGRADAYLCYRLARTFANSSENGAYGEFLAGALESGIEEFVPEVRLNFAEFLASMGRWNFALANVALYEERCGANERSRLLKITSHIGAREFAEAEQYLEQMSQHDPNWMMSKVSILESQSRQIRNLIQRKAEKPRTSTVLLEILTQRQQEAVDQRSKEQLESQIKDHLSAFLGYMDKLLEKDPNSVSTSTVSSLYEDAIAAGQTETAKQIVDKFMKYQPDNLTMLVYKRLLAEPDPAKVPVEKILQIREEVISGIADPVKRALNLGIFYQINNEPNKAEVQFKKVVGILPGAETLQADENTQRRAAASLFDIALNKQDWDAADKIMQMARQKNLDDCSGDFFAARIALAREQYDTALASIESALVQRPVFGYGYLLRSRINTALGKEGSAIADIQTAANLNPIDKVIARERASQLYQRNKKLADNVSSAQLAEARGTLDWAMALNPGDAQLINFYAEYISDAEPQMALALRQSLQENAPSMQNALLLARLAMRLGLDSTDTQKRQALFGMAAAALEQAKRIDPQNPAVLESYADFYRQTGQNEKVEQMLSASKDSQTRLLWRHYVKSGRLEEAKKTLDKAYEANPKDTDTIRGLLFLAEKSGNRNDVIKYAEQLLSVEQTAENHLLLVQTYLNTGLVKEAEQKLASFQERYPTDGRGLLLGAWLSMKQGHTKEALELINKRLATDQNDATAWQLRGQINFMMAEYDQSIMDLKRSKTSLDSALTRLLLAKTYLKTGRSEDAITELKSAFEDPQAPDEVRTLLERIYMRDKRKEALDDFYAKVMTALPESIPWQSRAAGFASVTGDWAKSEQLYDLALGKCKEQGQESPDALGGYLRALMVNGKMDKLFEEGAKYIDGNLAPVAYLRMAEGKMKLGDRATAIKYCSNGLEKAGDNTMMVTQVLQNAYSLLGQQQTEELCRQMLTAQPDAFASNWAMFNFAKFKEDYNKAVEYIDKCLSKVDLESDKGLECTLQKAESLILIYQKTSDNNYLKRAMEQYESLLAKVPNNTYVLNNVAYLLAENNQDLNKAMEYAKRACDTKSDEPMYLDTYAFVCYKNGKYAEATQYAQAAIQQYESRQQQTPVEVYEHLGQSQEKLGELTQARAAYQQALDAGGEGIAKPLKERITAAMERLGK